MTVSEEHVKITSKPGESLLFVYQTKQQKRLLLNMGMNNPYQTPLTKQQICTAIIFHVAKLNVDYQIVAKFLTETESTEGIVEAPQVIKQQNPTYRPQYFMSLDYSKEEITALEDAFLGNLFM